LRGATSRTERCLILGFLARRCGIQSEELGDLYPHANARRRTPAHGAVGLPYRSEAGPPRRERGGQLFFEKVEQVLSRRERSLVANALKNVGSERHGQARGVDRDRAIPLDQ